MNRCRPAGAGSSIARDDRRETTLNEPEHDVDTSRDDAAPPRDTPRGSTRAQFVQAAGAGVAGLALGAGGAYWWLRDDGSAQATATQATTRPAPIVKPTGREYEFVSRPDLRPPVIEVLERRDGAGDDLMFLAPPSGPGQRGPLIVDNDGHPVWFKPSTPETTMDFRAAVYKGKPVLTWWEGRHIKGVGLRGSYLIADDSYREIARFRAGDGTPPDFHEYMLTPDDTALVLSYPPFARDLSSVGGPRNGRAYDGVVQELEIPSGRVLWEWRSRDHVTIEESYQTQVGNPYDYFHINSAGFDEDGNLLISARNTWAIYKVNRESGEVMWRLGGKKSDFEMGPGTRFAFQHDARSHDGGRLLSLFDNGPVPNTKKESRALVLELDMDRMRATVAREIRHTPPLFARITGNTQIFDNGNYLVCWGNTGYFTEYSEGGDVLFDAKLPQGGQNYRVYRLPWKGRPSEPPKLARAPDGRSPRVYVSWNGATGVAAWWLRTGRTAGALADGPTTAKGGFETELAVPERARYAEAVAVDRNGNALRTSNLVEL